MDVNAIEATKTLNIIQNESTTDIPISNESSAAAATTPIVVLQNQPPIEEMLGSVTTFNSIDGSELCGSSKNCLQLRTSARVFKKMKLDNALALTTAPAEKEKKDATAEAKEVKKPFRPQWSQEDKDIFFEALNEFGKDFDAIQQHINNRFKKKGLPETLYKTKDQVRHFYHRTWHKISKHLKFSEDIKKLAQELYALINFGEFRKKGVPISEKTCVKLNELIYRGSVAIRVKGKTIRIKTPMCRALRKLNQLDEKHEDLKLPTRVQVELRPKDMSTWLNVQFMAQNPRVRVMLPLQRRLSALLSCVNERWKSQIARTHEKVHNIASNASTEVLPCSSSSNGIIQSIPLRLAPKANLSVQVPVINLSEYLTSHRICLNAYEERIGVKVPGEQLWQNMCASFKGGGKASTKKAAAKRQRNESTGAGDKSCVKKESCDEHDSDNAATVSDLVDKTINTILSLQTHEQMEIDTIKEEIKSDFTKTVKTRTITEATNTDEQITKIKEGWTLENCGTLTIGELYLMFGYDSKLELEYSWDPPEHIKSELNENEAVLLKTPENNKEQENLKESFNCVSITLRKLLSLAKLHYRKERIKCPCGHVCGGPSKTASANRHKSFATKNNLEKGINESAVQKDVPLSVNCMRNVTVKAEPLFRKPDIYPSNGSSTDAFRAQLDSLQRMRPKYTNRKGRPARNKHVVVERMLPLLPKPPVNGHSIVTMKVISQTEDIKAQNKLRPIAPRLESSTEDNNKEFIEENDAKVTQTSNSDTEYVTPTFFLSSELSKIDENNAQTSQVLQEEMIEHCVNNNNEIISQREVTSPTSISNFLDLDIPTADTNDLILQHSVSGAKDSLTSFAGLLSDDIPDTTPLSSPSRILKENDNQWLNSEVHDYSLTSLLGHLESPMKAAPAIISCDDDTPITQDIDSQFPSLLGENGVDFVDQFVDMAAQVTTENIEIQKII